MLARKTNLQEENVPKLSLGPGPKFTLESALGINNVFSHRNSGGGRGGGSGYPSEAILSIMKLNHNANEESRDRMSVWHRRECGAGDKEK